MPIEVVDSAAGKRAPKAEDDSGAMCQNHFAVRREFDVCQPRSAGSSRIVKSTNQLSGTGIPEADDRRVGAGRCRRIRDEDAVIWRKGKWTLAAGQLSLQNNL